MISPKPFLISAAVLLGTAGIASAHPSAPPAFHVKVFAGAPSGATSGPDDITWLDGHVYVGWQNGVGPKGEASTSGATTSVVVEYSNKGKPVGKWTLKGKVDGLGADTPRHMIVVTVNEDGNSSLYTIRPAASKPVHYTYAPSPDGASKSALSTGGGTDSVTVIGTKILVAASAPTHHGRTATFWVKLSGSTAKLKPTFAATGRATDALTGNTVTLHLTDPDSNGVVPGAAGVFGGDYMLDSQADQELIFASGIGGHISLQRLQLTWDPTGQRAGVDDVRFAKKAGETLYIVDNKANKVYSVKGPWQAGDGVASMDTIGSRSTGSMVASLNLGSGALDPLITGLKAAKGLLFAP